MMTARSCLVLQPSLSFVVDRRNLPMLGIFIHCKGSTIQDENTLKQNTRNNLILNSLFSFLSLSGFSSTHFMLNMAEG